MYILLEISVYFFELLSSKDSHYSMIPDLHYIMLVVACLDNSANWSVVRFSVIF